MVDRIQRGSDLSAIANYARSSSALTGGGGLTPANTYQINQLDAVRKLGPLGLNSPSSDTVAQWVSNRLTQSSEVKISTAARIQSGLADFQTQLQNLSKNKNPLQVQSAQPDVLSAKATRGGALRSSISVEVTQLAQSQQIQSRNFSVAEAQIGTGRLSIQRLGLGLTPIADPITLNITPQNNTLAGIAQAINGSSATIRANVARDNAGSRLVLSGNLTGQDQGFLLQVEDDDGNNADELGLSALNFDPRRGQAALRVAQDAKLTLDQRELSNPNNQFIDQSSNLNLDVQSVGSTSLRFSLDTASLSNNFVGLVDGYNRFRDVLGGLSDAKANQLRQEIGDGLLNLSTGQGITKLSISDLGFTQDAAGKLTLNTTRLNQQLQAQPEAVNTLLNQMSERISARVDAAMNERTRFVGLQQGARGASWGAASAFSGVGSAIPSTSFPFNFKAQVGVLQYLRVAQFS